MPQKKLLINLACSTCAFDLYWLTYIDLTYVIYIDLLTVSSLYRYMLDELTWQPKDPASLMFFSSFTSIMVRTILQIWLPAY